MNKSLLESFSLPRNALSIWKNKCSQFSKQIDDVFESMSFDPIHCLSQDWNSSIDIPDRILTRKYFLSLYKTVSSVKEHLISASH